MRSLTASQMIYKAAGLSLPQVIDDQECWLCGGAAYDPAPSASWVKDTFNDIDKVARPRSSVVCGPCRWCAQKTSLDLARITNRSKPQNFRNYSHIVDGGRYFPFTKSSADRARMASLFRDHIPEVAIIATSGQKHLYFRAQVNPLGQSHGWVQYEESSLRISSRDLVSQIDTANALFQMGFFENEILSGKYSQSRILDVGVSAWMPIELRARSYRLTSVWPLAVFLSSAMSRDKEQDLEENDDE